MAESLTLTTPIPGPAAITVMRPSVIQLNNITKRVIIQLHPWNGTDYVLDGRFEEFVYDAATTPTGATLLRQLNKADLSAISLEKRIMTQLIASGYKSGTVGGTPD